LDFKIQILAVEAVKRPFCIIVPNLRRSIKPLLRYRDFFCNFQDGGRRHLGFSKIRNFNGQSSVRGQCASPSQISSKSVKPLQKYGDLTFFQNGGHPPPWIYWARIGTTRDDHLVVSIVVQNVVGIDAVVSMI